MGLLESVTRALQSVAGNRMRSGLTMLGVVIGVAAVIALVALGQGANTQIQSSIQGLGTNLLMVTPGQATSGGVRQGAGSMETLTLEDAEAIEKQVTGIDAVAPEVSTSANVVSGSKNTQTSVVGTTPDYALARNAAPDWGRFIAGEDVLGARRVAILGSEVVSNLEMERGVVGRQVLVNRVPFTIVGVLPTKGSMGPMSQDDQIIIPISTAMNRLTGNKALRTINIAVSAKADSGQVSASLTELLRGRHRLATGEEDDFMLRSQAEIMSTLSTVTGTFTVLLGGIASISLLVGGIGIMNIMLVSVTERTKEIGILKALGARRSHILSQFMIESVVLSGLGGLIGVAVGIAGSYAVQELLRFETTPSASSILLAFSFSLLVGVFFGVYPAMKASRLHPIDALHYE